MPKCRNIKIVIFRKHFSHSLKTWFNMFLFWHFDLFHFFVQFFAKEMFWKLFFSIFLQFLIHVLIPSGTKFITNIETVSEKKKSKTLSVSLRKCQQEAITQYWLKSTSILKIVLFVLNFSAPNTVRPSQNWSILLHWMWNFVNLDKIIKIYVFKNFLLLSISL